MTTNGDRNTQPEQEPRRVSTFHIDLPVAQATIRKSLRTEIRLKHSIAADTELGTLMPKVDQIMVELLHLPVLPTLDLVRMILSGKRVVFGTGKSKVVFLNGEMVRVYPGLKALRERAEERRREGE
jgi:hypothetical protein